MSEFVRVTNPNPTPVEVPGYGILGAGEEAVAPRSGRLRRAIEHGALETVSGKAAEADERKSGRSGRKTTARKPDVTT